MGVLVFADNPCTTMPESPSTPPAAIHRPWMFEVDRLQYIKRARYLREKIEADIKRSRKLLKNKTINRADRRELQQAVTDAETYGQMLTRIITGNIRADDPVFNMFSEQALKQRIRELAESHNLERTTTWTHEDAIRNLYDPVLSELVGGEFLIFETLTTPEAGRYVLTPGLAQTLGNTTVPPMPDGLDLDYYGRNKDELLHLPWYIERLHDLKLPHPYMTVRIPAFTLEQPASGGTHHFDVPETDVVLVSRPIVTDFLRRMNLPASTEHLVFPLPGHYPLAYSQPVKSLEQVEAEPSDISVLSLTPLGHRGIALTITADAQPDAIRQGNEVGHLMTALLMMMNEPRTQTLDRFGRRVVDPSVDRPSTKRRPPSRLRYEILGTRTRFTAQVPGTARGPQTVRSFVRGHWARWPLMSQNDRLFQRALDCLTLLDDQAVHELVPDAPLDEPETYAQAIRACLGTVLDHEIGRRSEDVMMRFLWVQTEDVVRRLGGFVGCGRGCAGR